MENIKNPYLNLKKGDVLYGVSSVYNDLVADSLYKISKVVVASKPDISLYTVEDDMQRIMDFKIYFENDKIQDAFSAQVVLYKNAENQEYINNIDTIANIFFLSFDKDIIKEICFEYNQNRIRQLKYQIHNLESMISAIEKVNQNL